MAEPMLNAPPLLVMSGIVKTFPGARALDGANLTVGPSEVHAVVGQNGAGKSTMMKILNGAYRRDAGTITFGGYSVDFTSPQQAQHDGVGTVYQEINLVPYRSVAENIFMGREPRRFGFINWSAMNRGASEILDGLNIHIDVRKPLMTFNVALQQMVAIARAVSFQSRLVVMDEPTSSLNSFEVETLFQVVRRLKASGVSVIYISHRLDELHQICDRITIMRDGRTVDERSMAEITKLEIVARMLGKELGEVRQRGATGFQDRAIQSTGAPLLEARHIRRPAMLQDASITVHPGEIVGLAGLLGSGRTELARVLFGADQPDSGDITYDGRATHFDRPSDAIKAGIGLCAEDRKADGIVPYMSVRENLTLAALPMLIRSGVVDAARQREIVDRFVDRLAIKTSNPNQAIRELSGGNQQKVLLARWLCLNPRLLILDEPTRGIDVGAKAEIQALIDELAGSGLGVLMISSEIEEIVEGSDRVSVLRDGVTVTEFTHDKINQDAIIFAMAHGESADVA
jgi:monosaccharide-transporting ATPase